MCYKLCYRPLIILVFGLLQAQPAIAQDYPELNPVQECAATEGADCAELLQKLIREVQSRETYQYTYDFLMTAAVRLAKQGHFELGLQAAQRARLLSSDSLSQQADALKRVSSIYFFQGSLDSSLFYCQKALDIFESLKDSVKLGTMYVNRGQIQKELGNYSFSMEDYLKALGIFKKLESLWHVARTKTEMATLAAVTGDVDKAIRYNKEAARFYNDSEDTATYAYTILNLANDLIYTGREDTALSLLATAIPIFEEADNTYLLMNAEAQTGRAYHQKGENAEAIEHLLRSNQLGREQNFISQLAYNQELLGRIYREQGDYDKALHHSRHALDLHREIGLNEEYRQSLQELATLYQALKQPDSALKYFREYMSVSDSLFSLEKQQQLNELKTLYETDLKEEQLKASEAEIGMLEEQNRAQKSRSLALGLGLMIVLMAGIGIISRQRTTMRLNRQIISQKEKAHQAELLFKTEEEKRLKADLDHKKRELASQALLMAEKNEMLRSFKQELYEVSEKLEESTMLTQVVQRMERAENKSQDWDKFMQIFEDVHPSFLKKLRTDFSKLTNNDIRLIVLMKMNFSNKEIASILHISEAGLKKARYRLRKKLDLTSEDNMHEFIRKL